MSFRPLVVRAIDVGYGHVKFTDGRDPVSHAVRTDSIPSRSPVARSILHQSGGVVMTRRDTFIVPVGGRRFEVGRDVNLALHESQETEVMDTGFALSDQYAARLFGALNYMADGLPDKVIDVLVLGLPLNTYHLHHTALSGRFVGPLKINERGEEVIVRNCHVYPQPLGCYMSHTAGISGGLGKDRMPLILSVDPGYNTLDWFTCKGLIASDARSGAVPRGMGAVIRAIAEDMIKAHGFGTPPAEMVRSIDTALSTGTPLMRYGRVYDLSPHLGAGNEVIHEAVNALKNSVGDGADIDVITLSGGGASFYEKAVREKFPHHEIVVLDNPAHANVRGLHIVGEMLGKSLENAMRIQDQARE